MNVIIIILEILGVFFLLLASAYWHTAIGIKKVLDFIETKYQKSKFTNQIVVQNRYTYRRSVTKALYSGYASAILFIILISIICLT